MIFIVTPIGVRYGVIPNSCEKDLGLTSSALMIQIHTLPLLIEAIQEVEHFVKSIEKRPNKYNHNLANHDDQRVFSVESTDNNRLAIVYYFNEKSLALCRLVNIWRLYKRGSDQLTISKGSLIRFGNLEDFIQNMKRLMDGLIYSVARRREFGPAVFFSINQLSLLTTKELDALCTRPKLLLDRCHQFHVQALDYMYEEDRNEILNGQREFSDLVS